ncbi:MAG: hypothetical protein AB7U71_14680 [Comamonas sp.]
MENGQKKGHDNVVTFSIWLREKDLNLRPLGYEPKERSCIKAEIPINSKGCYTLVYWILPIFAALAAADLQQGSRPQN